MTLLVKLDRAIVAFDTIQSFTLPKSGNATTEVFISKTELKLLLHIHYLLTKSEIMMLTTIELESVQQSADWTKIAGIFKRMRE